jgi:ribosomal protein S27AE
MTAAPRIAIDCLKCGHCGSMPQEALSQFGLEPSASITSFIKRLVCSKCGSQSVRAFRYVPEGAEGMIA